jgi:hypothetical protein
MIQLVAEASRIHIPQRPRPLEARDFVAIVARKLSTMPCSNRGDESRRRTVCMAPQTMEITRAAQTPHIIPRYLPAARLPCKESACALDLVGLQVRGGQKSPVDGACG